MERLTTFVHGTQFFAATANALQDAVAAKAWVEGALLWGGTLVSSDGANVSVGPIAQVVFPAGAGLGLSANGTTVGVAKLEGGGAFAADTWYYLYVFNNAGTLDYQISATAPGSTLVWKSGTTTHRYLGCFRTDATPTIVPFHASRGRYLYRPSAYGGSVVSTPVGGTATSWTALDLSAYVPPHCLLARLRANVVTTGAENRVVALRAAGDTAGLAGDVFIEPAAPTIASTTRRELDFPVVAGLVAPYPRTVIYRWDGATNAGTTFVLEITGFYE